MLQLTTNKGVTIVENIISIFLMGIIVTSTMFALVSTQRYITASNHHYQAINIARNELERIFSGDILIQPGNSYTQTVTIDNARSLTGTLNVNYSSVTSNVDVTVTWNENMWTNQASQEQIVAFLP
jgi:Tfp pilus assembly protein PilV